MSIGTLKKISSRQAEFPFEESMLIFWHGFLFLWSSFLSICLEQAFSWPAHHFLTLPWVSFKKTFSWIVNMAAVVKGGTVNSPAWIASCMEQCSAWYLVRIYERPSLCRELPNSPPPLCKLVYYGEGGGVKKTWEKWLVWSTSCVWQQKELKTFPWNIIKGPNSSL